DRADEAGRRLHAQRARRALPDEDCRIQDSAAAPRRRPDPAAPERQAGLPLGRGDGEGRIDLSDWNPKTFWDFPETPPTPEWRARRRFATALRELASLCVTSDAPHEELARAADEAERIAASLRAHPARTFGDAFRSLKGKGIGASIEYADRNAMV